MFDRPAKDSPQFNRMLNYIESAGMKSKQTKMPENMRASMSKDGVFEYDPERMTHLDMLHEIRHSRQIKKASKTDALGNRSLFEGKQLDVVELGSYRYEQRMADKLYFSDEYKAYLEKQINNHRNSSVGKIRCSKTMQKIIKAIDEPRLLNE